ncbi:MAG: hypothetical protein R3B95_09805 [Nitrospirales bacterium]|nr:hypothetical protein [Nitrospirales bacterium]
MGVQKPAELGMPMADLIRRECRADPLSLDEAVDRLGIGTGLRTVTTPGRVRAAPTRRVAEPLTNGQRLRALPVRDVYTREWRAIHAGTS